MVNYRYNEAESCYICNEPLFTGLSTPFNVEWLRKTGNQEIFAMDMSLLPFQ